MTNKRGNIIKKHGTFLQNKNKGIVLKELEGKQNLILRRRFIAIDRTTVIKLAEQYAIEVTKILNPKVIAVYGSYIKGTANSDSDIDIAVIFEDLPDDYLEISKQLYKLRRNISADIEPILLTLPSKSGFIAEVLRTGVIVYKSQDFHFKNYT